MYHAQLKAIFTLHHPDIFPRGRLAKRAAGKAAWAISVQADVPQGSVVLDVNPIHAAIRPALPVAHCPQPRGEGGLVDRARGGPAPPNCFASDDG